MRATVNVLVIGCLLLSTPPCAYSWKEIPKVVNRAGWPLLDKLLACPVADSHEENQAGTRVVLDFLAADCIRKIRTDESFYVLQDGVLRIDTEHVTVTRVVLSRVKEGAAMVRVELAPYDEGPIGGMAGGVYVYYFVAEQRPSEFTVRQRTNPAPPLPAWARSQAGVGVDEK